MQRISASVSPASCEGERSREKKARETVWKGEEKGRGEQGEGKDEEARHLDAAVSLNFPSARCKRAETKIYVEILSRSLCAQTSRVIPKMD